MDSEADEREEEVREKAEVAPPPRSVGPCVSRARGQNLAAAPPLCGGISPSPYTRGVERCSPCRNESHPIAPAISSELSRRRSHTATNLSRGSRAVSALALRGNRLRRVSRKRIGATLRFQSASKEECRHPHVARGSSYTLGKDAARPKPFEPQLALRFCWCFCWWW